MRTSETLKQRVPISRDLHLFADDVEIARGCRMMLTAHETLTLYPALHQLEILDLSDSSVSLLAGTNRIEVRSGNSILAFGELMDTVTQSISGKRQTSLVFSPGLSLWQSSVSLSVAAGMKISDTIRSLLAEAGKTATQSQADQTGTSDFDSSSDSIFSLAAFTAEDRILSRPQAFFGRTCDALAMLAETAGADAFMSPAGVCVSSRPGRDPAPAADSASDASSRNVSAFYSVPESALLSAPVVTGDRLLAVTEMIGWPLGENLTITWQGVSRTGRLVSRLIQADTGDGPWKSELELELDPEPGSELNPNQQGR